MKTLYVDLENGYKTLGSKTSIKEKFGYQPLSFNDFSSFREFIKQIWSVQNVETEVDVDGVKIKQKIEYQKTIGNLLEEIMNNLRWRHTHVKNIIDWKKFVSGS